jgi:hypothetical protein
MTDRDDLPSSTGPIRTPGKRTRIERETETGE